MAAFVRAFLKNHFDERDSKEEQYNYYCIEKGFDSERVAEVIWNDEKFPEKAGNLRKGMINQKEWEDGLLLARKELGDAIVDLAEQEFEKEKQEADKSKKEKEEYGEKMAKEDKSAYTRTDAGSKASQVELLLPRLVKCSDSKHILVHPLDKQAAKEAGLEVLFIREDGEKPGELGPIVAMKKFDYGDEPEFWWEVDKPETFNSKLTPYAVYGRAGMWKGDRVWQPWDGELHGDPDADIKEIEEEKKKYATKEHRGPKPFEERDDPCPPEEEWLSEQKHPEAVKAFEELEEQRQDIGFKR
eukprot:gnl/MRDRNA2_/MRDRNA2_88658_c0_seq1.p1 gnl/MRDRNA2_/MRDRNA2_88658_c0~~gnl/MRDRNA2_/MRDRNA2_88658_c0_seq1.p1  ORF type:complete len:300 (+),score=98.28 gnl/MRDRNA2_/MRDRNA2_88658_c0_seq1:89-988(+)